MTGRPSPRRGSCSYRIAIVTGAALSLNPRTAKEAASLARAGYDVVVHGASPDPLTLERDRAFAQSRGFAYESVAGHLSEDGVARREVLWRRLRGRVGHDAFRLLGLENRWQLGYYGSELLRRARSSTADYFIVHLEQSMWVGDRLIRSGERVGVDIEDWFSEDLLPEARRKRPVDLLRTLERRLLQQAAHASCPSRTMSAALATQYGCAAPNVIYNSFPWSDRNALDGATKDRRDRSIPSLHWYSQTLGVGRGLEDLLEALLHVRSAMEIHLRGQPAAGFTDWLARRVPERWRERVFLHPVVSHDELLSRIAEHDIGFAGEMKYCRNKDLTVSNKMLHYLLAGLAVVASDTSGQQEVAREAPDAVFLYPSGNPAALAERLNALLTSHDLLRKAKAAATEAAKRTFCWERQEGTLLDAVARALATRPARAPAR